jgi:hypothetical protein
MCLNFLDEYLESLVYVFQSVCIFGTLLELFLNFLDLLIRQFITAFQQRRIAEPLHEIAYDVFQFTWMQCQ